MQSIVWDGQKVTKPGMYSKMPLADYHRGDICDGPSVSSSGLRTLWSKSPKHFWDKSPLNPNRVVDDDEDEKKALILGRATHHLMVEQARFSAEFIQRPRQRMRDERGKRSDSTRRLSGSRCRNPRKAMPPSPVKDGGIVLLFRPARPAKATERNSQSQPF